MLARRLGVVVTGLDDLGRVLVRVEDNRIVYTVENVVLNEEDLAM
ncbi:MAG: hypothetical protein QM784_10640 [Polyangiaceae bacterium]